MTNWILTESFASDWLERLTTSWETKNVSEAVSLFSRCRDYRESPFLGNAANDSSGVADLWNEIEGQSSIVVTARLLAVSPSTLVAAYEASYEAPGDGAVETSGVWAVGMENGWCVTFQQWYMIR